MQVNDGEAIICNVYTYLNAITCDFDKLCREAKSGTSSLSCRHRHHRASPANLRPELRHRVNSAL